MSNLTDVDLLLTQIEVILSDLGVKDSDSPSKYNLIINNKNKNRKNSTKS